MSNYSSMLRDPRWQRKRLEIMNAKDFTCENCGSKSRELQIHHCWYEPGKKPWEYDDLCFWLLCNQCHEQRQLLETEIKMTLAQYNFDDLEGASGLLDSAMVLGSKASASVLEDYLTQ